MEELTNLLKWQIQYEADPEFAAQQEAAAAQEGFASAAEAVAARIHTITHQTPPENGEEEVRIN